MLQKSNQVHEESGTHRMLPTGNNWMITADHPLATQAGAEVLAGGGHAVDAAIAANLVLTVVRPHMCSLGGDLFARFIRPQPAEWKRLMPADERPWPRILKNTGPRAFLKFRKPVF